MNKARDINFENSNLSFSEVLHVGRPNVGNYEHFFKLVQEIFERRWFSNNGQLVNELESCLGNYLGVKHCILLCNGTIGLLLAVKALGLRGEVIVPAFTFIATVHALQWMGIKPVFVDVDPITHLIDPTKIVSLINENTSAIIGVHLWGNPCNTQTIEEIAQKFQLKVIYDAAHAFSCRYQAKMIGNFGDCEVFSFHATKFFQTFEGGAITTNNDQLAQKIRLMKNFGFQGLDNVVELGINGKMTEIQAAMGLVCLESLDEIITINRRNYEAYRKNLGAIRGIRFFNYDHIEQTNFQYIIIEVDSKEANLTRDELMQILLSKNIRARRYFYPGCHQSEPYKTLYPEQLKTLSNTDFLCDQVLALPTGQTVSVSDISIICQIIQQALSN
jgi:dTDP-4-amino-4,6-dideoxygalactose transaminase